MWFLAKEKLCLFLILLTLMFIKTCMCYIGSLYVPSFYEHFSAKKSNWINIICTGQCLFKSIINFTYRSMLPIL